MTLPSPPFGDAPADADASASPSARARPAPGDRSTRLGARRAPLPQRRAVLGALLVTSAALLTLAAFRAAGDPPRQSMVIAARAVDAGETIHSEDLRVVSVDAPAAVVDRSFTDVRQVVGATALAPLSADDPVTRSAVLTSDSAPTGDVRELSMSLDRDRALDGNVQRGEVVDLLATFGTGPDAVTSVVVHRARVVAVSAANRSGVAGGSRVTLSLALTNPAELIAAAHANEIGKVTVVRSTRASDADPGPDTYRLPSTPAGTTNVPGQRR